MSLSEANSEDAAALHARCFAQGWPAEDFRRYGQDAGCFARGAALDDGKLLGLAIARMAGDEAEILTMATDPLRRRKGVARRLLSMLLDALSGAGAAVVYLEVGATNRAAIALYKSCNFKQVGHRTAYYRRADGFEDALIMRRLLGSRQA